MKHAILSPSGAGRWLACPPSARLEAGYPDTAGPAALEGTLAHKLAEAVIRNRLGQISIASYNSLLAEIQSDNMYNADMHEHVNNYASFVLEKYKEAKTNTIDALIQIEAKVDLREYVPDGFGTCDAVIIAGGTMDVIDLKFGRGVRVDSTMNKQMMLYALGAFLEYGYLYSIHDIQMTIYQPRINNFSSFLMPVKDLLLWADNELKHTAKLAHLGKGEYKAGDHCKFCKVRGACKTYASHHLSLTRQEFSTGNKLSDEQITTIITKADSIRAWIKSVEDYALSQAIKNNKQWPGFKPVQTTGRRKYKDEEEVIKRLISNGYKENEIQEIKPLGITAMEKTISKKAFNNLLGDLITRDEGKLTLVPDDDPRLSVKALESAQEDFMTINTVNKQ